MKYYVYKNNETKKLEYKGQVKPRQIFLNRDAVLFFRSAKEAKAATIAFNELYGGMTDNFTK